MISTQRHRIPAPLIAGLIFFLALCPITAAGQPVIGVIYAAPHFERLTQRNEDPLAPYRAALEAEGAVVLVIGQGMSEALVDEKLERMDGLLLPGGIDVEPSRYNEPPHPKLEKTDAALDALEWRALDHARAHSLPVLGICRGHQVINVYYGGSLIQDIPAQHESETVVVHRNGIRTHDITLVEGALLRELLGADRYEVNTYHHQAVKDLAPGFRLSARTDDGIVEAIESTGEVFILGVQFHPEKMLEEKPELRAIFARFIQEVQKHAADKTTAR